MKKKKLHITDWLEQQVADALQQCNIEFSHASTGRNQRLDFYLPVYDIYIEVKHYHSERSAAQLASQDNVILLQGRKAVDYFCKHLSNDAYKEQLERKAANIINAHIGSSILPSGATSDIILQYIKQRPWINASALEQQLSLPAGTIRQALTGARAIPVKHLPAIVAALGIK